MLEFICGTAIGITSIKIYKYDFVKKFCNKINVIRMIKEDIENKKIQIVKFEGDNYAIRKFVNEGEYGGCGYLYKNLKEDKWIIDKNNKNFKNCLGTLNQCNKEMQKMADKEKYNNDCGTPIKTLKGETK